MTTQFELESRARELLLGDEQEALVALLNDHVPEWRTSGKSLGDQLIFGIRESGIEQFIEDLLARIQQLMAFGGGGGGAGSPPLPQAVLDTIAGLQAQGIKLAASGAPDFVLEHLREQIEELGNGKIGSTFALGGFVGPGGRRVPIDAHVGELILNPAQQQQALGNSITIEQGAFAGMFSGANLAGSPQENGREFERAVGRVMEDILGRQAFVGGS